MIYLCRSNMLRISRFRTSPRHFFYLLGRHSYVSFDFVRETVESFPCYFTTKSFNADIFAGKANVYRCLNSDFPWDYIEITEDDEIYD